MNMHTLSLRDMNRIDSTNPDMVHLPGFAPGLVPRPYLDTTNGTGFLCAPRQTPFQSTAPVQIMNSYAKTRNLTPSMGVWVDQPDPDQENMRIVQSCEADWTSDPPTSTTD